MGCEPLILRVLLCSCAPLTGQKLVYGLPIFLNMGNMAIMKTTIDIQDELMARAKEIARRTGRSLRAVVEEGLRRVLADEQSPNVYRLPDFSVGDPNASDPLEALSWQDLREEIYGNTLHE